MMQEIATLSFHDADSGEEALAIVRAGPGRITLGLALRRDGDIEVVLQPSDCEALVEALAQAMTTALRPTA